MKHNPQQGVALVITLLLLSVITFLAITFLVMSRREGTSVTGMTDQIIARFAAETAAERATAEMLAPILAYTNPFATDLRVSTNYINPYGFDPVNGDYLTNTSYAYTNGQPIPITSDDYNQNLANLFYNPRPPVFIVTNRATGSNEFRYYLDLNRNGRYDTNGFLPVLDTNGVPIVVTTNTVFDSFIGDPEWIGLLERPEFPHSASNRFTARYAYLVAPAGMTLDLNYLFNQTAPTRSWNANNAHYDFRRNQGVGSWEINLPAFLRDLNTNYWRDYAYDPLGGLPLVTPPFLDAFWFLNYRYGGNYNSLQSVHDYFSGFADTAFQNDMIDEYSDDVPLMANTWLEVEGVSTPRDPVVAEPWPGAGNTNHFFTMQELFDPAKTSGGLTGFTNRLLPAGTQTSSYDRYTFYRLLSQLGTDSGSEPPGKINLNYDNVTQDAAVFSNWNPLVSFTNVANRLLINYTTEWFLTNPVAFRATFGTSRPFGATNIPVWVGNRLGSNFVYSPSVHRLLQLAANIYDATTNSIYPSVFRPVLVGQGSNVYITGFTHDVGTLAELNSHPLKDLVSTTVAANVGTNDLVFGVPLVIGAKKGLPSFNEFAMQSVFQITRKLQVTRTSTNRATAKYTTNMMYVVGISNVIGVEAWNSYRTNYTNPVDIYVTNYLSMELTNDAGLRLPLVANLSGYLPIPNATNTFWQGYGGTNPIVDAFSFKVPLKTNVVFLPDGAYRYNPPRFDTNLNVKFETAPGFPQPQWRLAVTNRLQFIMVSGGRLIDYVQLNGLNGIRDLSGEMANTGTDLDHSMWLTNRLGGNDVNDPPGGVVNQIDFSLGNQNSTTTDWTSYGQNQASGSTKLKEIDKFRVFFGLTPLTFRDTTNSLLEMQVPFTPTRRISQYLTWQANDPLVHYTASDLAYVALGNGVQPETLKTPITPVKNLGVLNDRYQPWGRFEVATDPNSFNLALKDPLMRSSDDWEFPTNKFPNIGWLGRVHRGSPWQTVYLKSTNILATASGLKTWADWTGNTNGFDATNSAPVNDWGLFDLFTTAPNENATRGQLSVNQTGLAAWSAVLAGVIALTNTSTDANLDGIPPVLKYSPAIIEPAGVYDPFVTNSWPPLVRIANAINTVRATNVNFRGTFHRLGDILAVPELTIASPFLNQTTAKQMQKGISDAVYERIPQQILSLLQTGEPRFVIYAYGQALKPADRSIVTSGPFFGLCTNYQITAEVATRTVLRVEGSPDPRYTNDVLYPYPNPSGSWRMDPLRGFYPPRIVIESYNTLPPD